MVVSSARFLQLRQVPAVAPKSGHSQDGHSDQSFGPVTVTCPIASAASISTKLSIIVETFGAFVCLVGVVAQGAAWPFGLVVLYYFFRGGGGSL